MRNPTMVELQTPLTHRVATSTPTKQHPSAAPPPNATSPSKSKSKSLRNELHIFFTRRRRVLTLLSVSCGALFIFGTIILSAVSYYNGRDDSSEMQTYFLRNARKQTEKYWTIIQNDFDLSNYMVEDIADQSLDSFKRTSDLDNNREDEQQQQINDKLLQLSNLPEPIVTAKSASNKPKELKKFGHLKDYAVITRKGFYGSNLPNQDRAILAFPPASIVKDGSNEHHRHDFLLGIFDGHGELGHQSSSFIARDLPRRLGLIPGATAKKSKPRNENRFKKKYIPSTILTASSTQDDIFRALEQSFIEMNHELNSSEDDNMRPNMSGSTASVILKWGGSNLYVANVGDSRTFICTASRNTGEIEIIYESRPDKPNLPDEAARIEASANGAVYNPPNADITGESSRVVVTMPGSASMQALAMSRSIGDGKAFQDAGVIPNPIFDVVDLKPYAQLAKDKIVFAVAASDGLLDRMDIDDVAWYIGSAMISGSDLNLLTLCEQLILECSKKWQTQNSKLLMQYRDDISIAATRVHL